MDYLNIDEKVTFNEDVESFEFHQYTPFNSAGLGNSDEIRLTMFQADAITLPSQSYLYLEGRVTGTAGTASDTLPKFINNAFTHLFESMRYELNSIEVDSVRNPGVVSTLKTYASTSPNQIKGMENFGFFYPNTSSASQQIMGQSFNVCLPLKHLMGFFEDYTKVIINAKQELILIRARTDVDALVSETDIKDYKIHLDKVVWNIPHVKVSDKIKLDLYRKIESGLQVIMGFRSWELHEFPSLPKTNKLTWRVKISDQISKPRYILVSFQTNRKDNLKKDKSKFDSIDIQSIKLFLNNIQFPYNDLKINFNDGKISQLYDNYVRFRSDYYSIVGLEEPLMGRETFKSTPFIVINCSKQPDQVRDSTVDVRLELETHLLIPDNTTAYCLILNDKSIEYNMLTGIVKKICIINK